MKPTLYIIAGCNGAGKTTASYSVLPNLLECREFVNADEIAKRVSDGGHNIPIETIYRRYWLGLQNFFKIFAHIVDSWMFFDNENIPKLIANNKAIVKMDQFNKIKELCLNKKK